MRCALVSYQEFIQFWLPIFFLQQLQFLWLSAWYGSAVLFLHWPVAKEADSFYVQCSVLVSTSQILVTSVATNGQLFFTRTHVNYWILYNVNTLYNIPIGWMWVVAGRWRGWRMEKWGKTEENTGVVYKVHGRYGLKDVKWESDNRVVSKNQEKNENIRKRMKQVENYTKNGFRRNKFRKNTITELDKV